MLRIDGEKSTTVIFYREYETAPAADTPVMPEACNQQGDGKRRVARASAVFNADQVDGAPPVEAIPDLGPVERNARFDAFVAATGAIIKHGGDSAYYQPSADTITMPDEHRFCGTDTRIRGGSSCRCRRSGARRAS